MCRTATWLARQDAAASGFCRSVAELSAIDFDSGVVCTSANHAEDIVGGVDCSVMAQVVEVKANCGRTKVAL